MSEAQVGVEEQLPAPNEQEVQESEAEAPDNMAEDYTAPKWTPDDSDVTFYFAKLKVIGAWKLGDKLRDIGLTQGRTLPEMSDYVSIVLNATHEQMSEIIMPELFATVTWSRNGSAPRALVGTEDEAFQTLTPDHLYVVMIRSLTVNFTFGTPTIGESGK